MIGNGRCRCESAPRSSSYLVLYHAARDLLLHVPSDDFEDHFPARRPSFQVLKGLPGPEGPSASAPAEKSCRRGPSMSLIDTRCQFRQALGCPLIGRVFAPMSYAATASVSWRKVWVPMTAGADLAGVYNRSRSGVSGVSNVKARTAPSPRLHCCRHGRNSQHPKRRGPQLETDRVGIGAGAHFCNWPIASYVDRRLPS